MLKIRKTTPQYILIFKAKIMRKITLLTIIVSLISLNLGAQTNKYLGVRAQFGTTLPQTSATIPIKSGKGGGIGLAYLMLTIYHS
jgi:hypothetical protein